MKYATIRSHYKYEDIFLLQSGLEECFFFSLYFLLSPTIIFFLQL